MIKLQLNAVFALTMSIFLFVSCGQSPEEKQAKEMQEAAEKVSQSSDDVANAMKNMSEALTQLQKSASGSEVQEPVDFRELKALLPEDLSGLSRKEATGEKAGAFGIKMSHAEARYASDDGKHIDIKITDVGTMKGFAAMATYAWANAEIDRETEYGYERTTEFAGYRAMEKYDSSSENAELDLIIADRFVVEANGSQVTIDELKSALKKIDFDELEKLKAQTEK